MEPPDAVDPPPSVRRDALPRRRAADARHADAGKELWRIVLLGTLPIALALPLPGAAALAITSLSVPPPPLIGSHRIGMVRFWPSRANSREINVTSPYATADGSDRRRTHETHLERRGSLQSEEMATNRARARTSSDRHGSAWFESPHKMGPNRLRIFLLSHSLGVLRL